MMFTSMVVGFAGLALVNGQAQPVPGVTGKLGDAAITTNNPAGVTYIANLPNSATSNIRGYVKATSNSNGTGVNFQVSLSGLPPASLGPFLYHIHDQPVPASGNCTATLAHLDPYQRGEAPPCYAAQPASCQVGDLSGKHGNITSSPFTASYLDLYTSTKSGLGSFLGNRSIVIHTSNTTRLTCANFVLSSSNTSSTNGTGTSTSTPTPSTFAGSAAVNVASLSAILGVAIAGVALLL